MGAPVGLGGVWVFGKGVQWALVVTGPKLGGFAVCGTDLCPPTTDTYLPPKQEGSVPPYLGQVRGGEAPYL